MTEDVEGVWKRRGGVADNRGRPSLQNPRTRILVSSEEQTQSVERIRKAERYRLDRLERSIEGKNSLAECIKTTREKTTQAILFAKTRWMLEKTAARKKVKTWGSLAARTGDGDDSCAVYLLGSAVDEHDGDGGGGSGAGGNVRSPSCYASSSPPMWHNRRRLLRPTIEKFTMHREGREFQPSSSWKNEKECRPLATAPKARAQTAPLLWDILTDAESGEALELRRPKWEFPSQDKIPTDAAVVSGDEGGDDGGRGADRRLSSEPPKNRKGTEGRYERLGSWFGDQHDDSQRRPCLGVRLEGGKRGSSHAMRRGGGGGALAHGTARGDDRDRRCHSPSTINSTSSKESSFFSEAPGFLTRAQWNHLPVEHEFGGVDGSVDGYSSSEVFTDDRGPAAGDSPGSPTFAGDQEPLTPRPTERLHSPFWVPPPQEPPFLDQPPRSSHLRARAAAATRSSSDRKAGKSASDNIHNSSDGGGVIVDTLSSSAAPPLYRLQQQPSSRLSRLSVSPGKTVPQQNKRCSSSRMRQTDNGGGVSSRWPFYDGLAPRSWAVRPTNGSSRGALSDDTTTTTVPDDDVRVKMARAQETRDRYLRQLHQMVSEERREETRREEALRRVSGHPQRHKRLQLRHDRERKDKRALISWIRRDLELIVVQKMADLGLVR